MISAKTQVDKSYKGSKHERIKKKHKLGNRFLMQSERHFLGLASSVSKFSNCLLTFCSKAQFSEVVDESCSLFISILFKLIKPHSRSINTQTVLQV